MSLPSPEYLLALIWVFFIIDKGFEGLGYSVIDREKTPHWKLFSLFNTTFNNEALLILKS